MVDCGAPFQFEVAAVDNCDGESVASIKIQGNFDTNTPGVQCVVVVATDSSGNSSVADCCITVLNNCDPANPVAKHAADYDGDEAISISEMLRVVQFFNIGELHCDESTEDGYAPGPGSLMGAPHSSDYINQDWEIGLDELLRLVQMYNVGAYEPCPVGEDGFCPVE